jgi:hypothetical protein
LGVRKGSGQRAQEKAQGSELRAQRKIARDLGFGGQKRLRAKSTGKGTGLRAQGKKENSKGFGGPKWQALSEFRFFSPFL